MNAETGVTLSEADSEALIEAIQNGDQNEWVVAYVARHVAEAEAQRDEARLVVGWDRAIGINDLTEGSIYELVRNGMVWKTRAEKAEAALAEAEQKGAREALLAAGDAVWTETLSRGRADLRGWLLDRAARIGGDS